MKERDQITSFIDQYGAILETIFSIVYLTLHLKKPQINIAHKNVTHQVIMSYFNLLAVAGGSRWGNRWCIKLFAPWA
jgi:hypothetical protein